MADNPEVFIITLREIAKYTKHDLTDFIAGMYLEEADKHGHHRAAFAAREAFKKNGRFPSIQELLSFLLPNLDKKDRAVELAAKVSKAVGSFGHIWLNDTGRWAMNGCRTWEEDARRYFGDDYDVVMTVVNSYGGWSELCKVLKPDDAALRAQLRDALGAIQSRSEANEIKQELLNLEDGSTKKLPPRGGHE